MKQGIGDEAYYFIVFSLLHAFGTSNTSFDGSPCSLDIFCDTIRCRIAMSRVTFLNRYMEF